MKKLKTKKIDQKSVQNTPKPTENVKYFSDMGIGSRIVDMHALSNN